MTGVMACLVATLWPKAGRSQWLTFRDELSTVDRQMWIAARPLPVRMGRWVAVALFVVAWPLVFVLLSWRDRGAGA